MEPKITQKAYSSVKWSILSNIIPRFITPVSTMILAGILSPDDFGVMAVIMLVITLAQIVTGLGMGAAVIQRQSQVDESATIAFWLNLFISLVMYVLLWFIAPNISYLYKNITLIPVLRVSGISLIIFSLTSIPTAMLQREMAFRTLFRIGVASQLFNAIVSLGLAYCGLNYWALVIGYLTSICVNLILTWKFCSWKPQFILNPKLVNSLFQFSAWVIISNFQSWLFLYADNAIAGYYFEVKGLGEYSLGFNFANLLPGIVSTSLSAVLYPTLCKIQNDKISVNSALLKVQSVAATIIFPMCFGLSAIANPVITLLYKDKWQYLGFVLGWLAIMPGISHIWSLNSDAYRSIGRPDIWPKIAGITLIILIPSLIIISKYGFERFIIVRFGVAWLLPIGNLFITSKYLNLSITKQIKNILTPAFCAMLMYLVISSIQFTHVFWSGFFGWVYLGSIICMGGIIYMGMLILLDRKQLVFVWASIKKSLNIR